MKRADRWSTNAKYNNNWNRQRVILLRGKRERCGDHFVSTTFNLHCCIAHNGVVERRRLDTSPLVPSKKQKLLAAAFSTTLHFSNAFPTYFAVFSTICRFFHILAVLPIHQNIFCPKIAPYQNFSYTIKTTTASRHIKIHAKEAYP